MKTFITTVLAAIALTASAQDYELRTLTFEDDDYKGGENFAGGNNWSSLIDSEQYGGSLLYGTGMGYFSESEAYKWVDTDNTWLSSVLIEGWGSWCYWTGGHAISNYGSKDIESYGNYNYQLTVFNANADGILTSGMGHNGSDNFCVHYGYHDNSGYSAESVPALTFSDGKARVIDHMYVAPTCYLLSCEYDGNGLTASIGDTDFIKIVATGYDNDGAECGQEEFYLCDGPDNIVTDWTKWDLSSLGEVVKVEFNMTGSSDNGFGFSQPAYFAYDDVAVRFPATTPTGISTFSNSDKQNAYDLMGRKTTSLHGINIIRTENGVVKRIVR